MKDKTTTTERDDSGTRLVFRFPATQDAPGRARLAAKNILQDNYGELVETSVLLVSELVTNSVKHAQLGPDQYIELNISTFEDGVKIDVIDSGTGFNYRPRKGALDRVGGWGLYMVEQLSHRWGISDSFPTTVWFELQKSPSRGNRRNGSKSYLF